MALILAVEPDAQQAAHIARVLRGRPRTELVIADSAVRALQTLANRVPDVLLTSPLLSRHDETTLADWLRELGAAGGHIQELTIPILAAPAAAPEKKRGVLASLRRARPRESRSEGCEPDMFAEQIWAYVDRASAGRTFESPPAMELLLLPPRSREVTASHGEPVVEAGVESNPDELTRLIFDPPVPELEAAPMTLSPAVVENEEELWVPIDLEEALPPPPKPARPRKQQVPRKKTAKRQATPLQDEWSLFDPQQCDFAALLATLDDITEPKDAHERRADATVRLSY